jgi:hypothetical protein
VQKHPKNPGGHALAALRAPIKSGIIILAISRFVSVRAIETSVRMKKAAPRMDTDSGLFYLDKKST